MANPESSSESLVYNSPMGPLKLTATEEGIAAVKYLFGKKEQAEKQEVQDAAEAEAKVWSDAAAAAGSEASGTEAGSHLKVCCEWLDAYFAGKLLTPDPPPRPKLDLSKKGQTISPFQGIAV